MGGGWVEGKEVVNVLNSFNQVIGPQLVQYLIVSTMVMNVAISIELQL